MWSRYIKNYLTEEQLCCCNEDAHPNKDVSTYCNLMEPLHLCVKSLHSWSWNVASSYSIIPRKLLLLSWIRLLCIKIQNYFFFFSPDTVVLTIPPCDILQCEFSSLNYHFIHLRLQLSINTVLPYSKGFHPLWRRNKTQIKQFCLLSLDDFF